MAQTFGELLERQLNDTPARPNTQITYRVVNAGVQGYGPVEQLLFFRQIVAAVQPDVVLVTVFVGNDAEEAVASEPKLSGKKDTSAALRDSFVTTLRRTVRRSMVLQVLRLRIVSATDRFRFKAPPEPPLQSYAAQPPPRIARGIEIARSCIQQIGAEAEQRGARMAIVLMPARFQVDDGDYGRLAKTVEDTGGRLVRDAATTRFAEGLGSLPYPMTDLLPPLRQALPGPDVFFQQNVHLTPRGHRVVADHLAQFIRAHGLQFAALRLVLPRGVRVVPRAASPWAELDAARRELLLLRGLGLAFLSVAGGLDDRRLLCGAAARDDRVAAAPARRYWRSASASI